MSWYSVRPSTGVSPRRALAVCAGWFVLGLGGILLALVPLRRDLARRAELEALSWLNVQADALRPLVAASERSIGGAVSQVPTAVPDTSAGSYAGQAKLWLVSALEGEPGLIAPVSADGADRRSLQDFGPLQAGIAAARSSPTRPIALVSAPDGLMAVAYLRLLGTGYGISMSMPAGRLYARVGLHLAACAAIAIGLWALACGSLYALIVQPALTSPPPQPACPSAPSPPATRGDAALRQVLYQIDLMGHETAADPQLREHLHELRECARQGLDEPGKQD